MKLAVVTRNQHVESVHHGFICVVDFQGKVLYSLGDYNTRIYFRSSAKPIQVIPLIHSGAAAAFNFSLKEIAIACASHSGQAMHQLTVNEMLGKLNLRQSNLHCGIMTPYNLEESRRILSEGKDPSVLHCSCSGKHSAMLALAKHRGYDVEDYEKADHPVQKEILRIVGEFVEEKADCIPTGIDGCGVPIYLLPINKIALSYSKLAYYSQNPGQPYHHACKTVFDAMTQFPEMVSGDNDFCTELMAATGGKLIGKVGSEAVYCLGIKDQSIGICIKIADGNERAVYPVVMQLLIDLNILNADEYSRLQHWHSPLKQA